MGFILSKISDSLNVDSSIQATTSIKAQAQGTHKIFELVQPPTSLASAGKGSLVDAASIAYKSKDYEQLRNVIRESLREYVYNDGAGKDVPIKDIIERRNQFRKNKVVKNTNSDGWIFGSSSIEPVNFQSSQTRYCCWDANKRGPLGETPLHVCFLNNSQLHNFLAKEMINVFPNLVHDIYQGDVYYGETCLHMAIANEDIEMLRFMLRKNEERGPGVFPINLQERCVGSFFSPLDQKGSRRDLPDSEWVVVNPNTDYNGLIYWGEYALSFAVCAVQKDAFQLLLDKGADLCATDTNGNNLLHMTVIHNLKDMFNLVYGHKQNVNGEIKEIGKTLLKQENKQHLTPLTLAAKLARKQMMDLIMERQGEIEWVFAKVTCAKYPLSSIDTIDPRDGSINGHSALAIILRDKSRKHLEMLDGVLIQLLHEKWKQYGKVRFYTTALIFFFYLVVFLAAFFLQPPPTYVTNAATNVTTLTDECYLIRATDARQYARFTLEILTYLMSIAYLSLAVVDIQKEGILPFGGTLLTDPMNASFYIAHILVLALLPCRLTCAVVPENVILTLAICTCLPHTLFFFRGFKLLGPFIVAVYNMISGDLLRFLMIYAIFLLGFSQAMFICFRGTSHDLFSHPALSILGMFVITLGEFGDLYEDFDSARHPAAAKTLFVIYMVFVTILLINVLIAMMGRTFNKIAETRWEWQRQWAKMVLIMEKSVSAEKRLKKQRRYSQPGDDESERWFVVRNFNKNRKKNKRTKKANKML